MSFWRETERQIHEELYRLIPRGAGIAPRPRRAMTVSENDHKSVKEVNHTIC